jgi:hypothetical protein
MYVHALCIEDATVNGILRGMPPMFKAVWFGGQLVPRDLIRGTLLRAGGVCRDRRALRTPDA